MPTKKEILDEIIKKLRETIESTICQADAASDASIDAPGRNESRYDSTKEEMGYLSNALSGKARDMQDALKELLNFSLPKKKDVVSLGSLVEIEMNNSTQLIFLIPCGGGQKIEINGINIFAVSKQAPLYSILLGKKIGEKDSFNGKPVTIKNIQ
jgi:hypothetical protein